MRAPRGVLPRDLPCCPRCLAFLGEAVACAACGLAFERRGALIDLLAGCQRELAAEEVERFYARAPFPGYAPGDDGPRLVERARAAPFLAALDRSLPPDELVLDLGCGTAQLAAFLALAGPRRRVIAHDGCRASLECAESFRERAGIRNLQLVRADLFDLPFARDAFPVVISRGVVHHTPDPGRAIAEVAQRVAPGGHLVLGFYESRARAFHRARQALARVLGRPLRVLDPLLRRRALDAEKERIWIEDQYRHPLEHLLPLPMVVELLARLGFGWVRSVPPTARGASLFDPTPEPTGSRMRAFRAALAWRGCVDADAGLIVLIARRHGAS